MAGNRIEAFDPSGKLVTIPEEQALDAQLQGYSLTSPEQRQQQALEAKYGDENARSLLEGVGRGGTFGLTDIVQAEGAGLGTRLGNWLADKTIGTGGADEAQLALDREATAQRAVDESKADILGRQQGNSTLSTIGEAGGAVGLGLATGGLGTAGLASRGASVLGRAAYAAGAGAIEGAAFGAAKAANDDYLADREITAERIMLGARDGALLGGAFGAGGSLLSSGVSAAAKKIGGILGGEGALGQYLDKLAGESAYKAATGRTSKPSIKLADRQGGAEAVGKTLLDAGIDLTQDAEGILAQTTQAADDVGAKIGAMAREADTFGAKGPSKAGLKDAIESQVLKKLDSGTFTESTANTVRGKLERLFDRLAPESTAPKLQVPKRGSVGAAADDSMGGLMGSPPPTIERSNPLGGLMGEVVEEVPVQKAAARTSSPWRSARGGADDTLGGLMGDARAAHSDTMTFEELRAIRKELDEELANWNSVAAEKGPLKAYRNVRRVMEDYWLNSAEEAAKKAGRKGFADEFKNLKRQYAHLALARDEAQEAVQTQLANRATSLTDTLAGVGSGAAVGGLIGMLTGIATSQAHRFVRERGRGVLATAIYRARQSATRGEQLMDDAAGGLLSATSRGFRNVAESAQKTVPIAGVVLNPRDPKSYEKTLDHLMQLQDPNSPERQQLKQRHADLGIEDPEQEAAMEAQIQRTADFLVDKAGPSGIDYTSPFAHLRGPRHDREKAAQLGRYADAAQNPSAALERIAGGKYTREDLETLKALYPRMWQRFGAKVKSQLAELKKAPDYRTQVELSRILDQPMSSFESPQFQAAILATDGATQVAEQQAKNTPVAQLTRATTGDAGSDRILARGE